MRFVVAQIAGKLTKVDKNSGFSIAAIRISRPVYFHELSNVHVTQDALFHARGAAGARDRVTARQQHGVGLTGAATLAQQLVLQFLKLAVAGCV